MDSGKKCKKEEIVMKGSSDVATFAAEIFQLYIWYPPGVVGLS